MPLPREYLSHNQVKLYIDCPQKYFFAYVEEIPPIISEKVYLGVAVHATLEHYFNARIAGRTLSLDIVLDVFRDTFTNLQHEKQIRWNTPAAPTRERGIAILRHFLLHLGPQMKPLMTEKELVVDVPGSDFQLKGVIDLVEEDFTLTDFKTASAKWSPKKAKKSLQMYIYHFLFERAFGAPPSGLKFEVFHARNAKTVHHQTLPIVPEATDIEAMLTIVRHVAENIRNGVFYRREHHLCPYCEYRDLCREKSAAAPL